MRINLQTHGGSRTSAKSAPSLRRSERGFAVLVVMILLVIMVSLAIGNNIALARLQTELQLVERRQEQRPSPQRTNAPATARVDAQPLWPERAASASKPQPVP